jgi:hypothetical protein
MSTETSTSPQQVSPAVSLFQKAHGRMTTLHRIDEQVNALLDQRRKIEDELRTIQTLINEEFDRVTHQPGTPGRILTRIAENGRDAHPHANGNGNGHVTPRVEIGEVVS